MIDFVCRPVIQSGLVALQQTATHTATCCTTYCNTPHHNSWVICLISEGSKLRKLIIQSGLGACCATHRKTPQHTAIHCNTMQHLFLHIRGLQWARCVLCHALQNTATHTHTVSHYKTLSCEWGWSHNTLVACCAMCVKRDTDLCREILKENLAYRVAKTHRIP